MLYTFITFILLYDSIESILREIIVMDSGGFSFYRIFIFVSDRRRVYIGICTFCDYKLETTPSRAERKLFRGNSLIGR